MNYTMRNESNWIYFSSDDNLDWMIDDIYVADARYQGKGKELVEAAFRKMKSLGGKRVGTWAPVPGAFGFWRKMGFNESGVRKL